VTPHAAAHLHFRQRQRDAFMQACAHAREPEGRQNVYWATKEHGRRSWDSVAACFCGCWACPSQSSFCSHCSGITDTVCKGAEAGYSACGKPPFPAITLVGLIMAPVHSGRRTNSHMRTPPMPRPFGGYNSAPSGED
jgi:hypothetical protein